MKHKSLYLVGSIVAVTLLLGGCGKSSPTNHSTQSSTTSQTGGQSSAKQSSQLWNKSKDQQLTDFINKWAPTMGQSYTKYNGKKDLRTKAGMYYPSDLSKTTVNGSNSSIGWAPSGKGSYDYNVVALYNYDRPGNAATHITYAFAFHNNQPVALVEQSTNGTPDWTQTKNTDVESNFERIAQGSKSSYNQSTSPTSKANDRDSSEMTFDKAAQILQKGGFTDFDYDNAKQTHDGSHATSDGGYVMITYPGAKGQDHFTITKTGKNKYHVEAVYGSSDGGFTPLDNQSDYGPTSADVSL